VLDELRGGRTIAQITGRRNGRYLGGAIVYADILRQFCELNPKLGRVMRDLSATNAVAQRAAVIEPTIRLVVEEIQSGKTMAQITGRHRAASAGDRVIHHDSLRKFCNRNPKLGRLIRETSSNNAAAQVKRTAWASPAIIRRSSDIMDDIQAAVPRHLPRDLRDDAIQNIWLAVTERRLYRSEIRTRAHEFVGSEYRENHDKWGNRSLDVRLRVDSTATLLDRLSSEAGTGYWDVNMMASTGRRK
jgi:hypothetical protein